MPFIVLYVYLLMNILILRRRRHQCGIFPDQLDRALANTYTYDSFGKLTASSGTITKPFQYTSREFDSETGLLNYRAR